MVRLDITQEELLSVLSNLDAETLFQKLESVKPPKAEAQHKESKSIKKKCDKWYFGWTIDRRTGKPIISRDTRLRPNLSKLIGYFASIHNISHTTVQVTRNHPPGLDGLHSDFRDFCPQDLISVGSFTGGESWTHRFEEDLGTKTSTRNNFVQMNGHLPHTVCPYEGIRWGLAYYDVAAAESVNDVALALLTSAGFTAITSEEALRRAKAAGMQVKMVSPGRFGHMKNKNKLIDTAAKAYAREYYE